MTTRTRPTTGVNPKFILGLVGVLLLTNLISFLFAFFVLAPSFREARAEKVASSLDCRQSAAQEYRDGDTTFIELDEALAECGGYRLR